MADWPDADELKQVLDITSDDWDPTVDRVLAAAIAAVKTDIGVWDEDVDVPTDSQAQAALRMAELLATRPAPQLAGARLSATVAALAADPTYAKLLKGSRRSFGVA